MVSFWIMIAFLAGGCAGFVLFAALQMSRDASRTRLLIRSSPLDADVATRW